MYGAMAGARLSTFLIRASTLSAHRTKSGAGKFWAEHDPGGEIRPAAPEHRVHNMPLPPRRQRIGLSVPGLIPECRDPPRRSASFMKIRCGKAADFWLAGRRVWLGVSLSGQDAGAQQGAADDSAGDQDAGGPPERGGVAVD